MTDQEITPSQFMKWRDKAVELLLDSPAGKDCGREETLAEIERLMPMAQEEGWLGMEWFLNVLPPGDDDEMEGIETAELLGTGTRGRNSSLKDSLGSDYIGLGTMMQNATDHLGERQRDDYKRWKAGIMERLEEIEAS
jgi:origin recognition complex subunit 6